MSIRPGQAKGPSVTPQTGMVGPPGPTGPTGPAGPALLGADVTLVAGTATVLTAAVGATSRIQLTAQSLGTVTTPQALAISARVNGVSFTILSSDLTDTSVVAWQLT